MIAEVIFSGTELLLGQILNINGQYLQRTLASMGIDSYHQLTVGDNRDRCAQAIRQAASRADLVFIGGGLGPTEDDVSRDALSEALQIPLVQDEKALNIVRRIYLKRGITMPEVNMKQGLVPLGGKALDNRMGVAPGIVLEHKGKVFFLLPGPPFEFNCMLDEQVVPYLRSCFPEELGIIYSRVLKICGIGESFLAQSLGDLFKSSYPTVFTCVKGSFIDLSITAKAEDEMVARRAVENMEETLRKYINKYIYGVNKDTLPGVIGKQIERRGQSLAVVEELSGGLLAHMLLSDPLSARVFAGGMVLREQALAQQGLSDKLTRPMGVPEEEAAKLLASSIRKLTGSSIGMTVLGPSLQDLQANIRRTVTVGIDLGDEFSAEELWLWDNKNQAALCAAEMALQSLWQLLSEAKN